MTNLLPPNATPWEVEFAAAIQREFRLIDAGTDVLRTLWDPLRCPIELLPHLARARSVDVWDDEWTEQVKRDVVAGAIPAHEIKGTDTAIINALALAGYPDARVIELAASSHDGTIIYDGTVTYDVSTANWAIYDVELDIQIPANQAETLRRIVIDHAPARSQLRFLRYDVAASRHDGSITYSGANTHGGA